MSDVANQPRVPARVVLLSLAALWACYFLVATLRGAIMGYEFVWAIFSRRLTICILSMLVMAAVWPLLQMLERKSGGVRLAIVLIGALPLAFLLSVINETVFSDIEMSPAYGSEEEAEAVKSGNVRISRDDAGNILLDLPTPVTQPAPRLPGTPTDDASAPAAPVPPEPTTTSDNKAHSITIHTNKTLGEEYGRWATVTDYAFTRYFLVLAWAALYFALAKAEEARVAERREGEHRLSLIHI